MARASILKIDSISFGKVINLNGQKFVKIGNDSDKGSRFIALKRACPAGIFNGYDMQEFASADCNCLTTPTGTGYTLAGVMRDSRDGKSYEIRKFADGKCWMVDNLAYGGAVDSCVNKTTFDGCGNGSTAENCGGVGASKSGNAWGYGDCRNNPGSVIYGYLYSWQAAMQHSSAYAHINYTGPTGNVQGICPLGWHIPAGGLSGEYQALHVAAGSHVNFWLPGGNWKGVFSGYYRLTGLGGLGLNARYWSSTQHTVYNAYDLGFDSSYVDPSDASLKFNGFTVRCIKN